MHFYREIQTDIVDDTIVDPAFSETSVRDFVIEHKELNVPTCIGDSPSDLTIRTNVGSAVVNDDYAVTADTTDQKFIKMSLVRNDSNGLLEIMAFEKIPNQQQEYADTPAGKTFISDLKEFSVVANGTVLVEEEDYI